MGDPSIKPRNPRTFSLFGVTFGWASWQRESSQASMEAWAPKRSKRLIPRLYCTLMLLYFTPPSSLMLWSWVYESMLVFLFISLLFPCSLCVETMLMCLIALNACVVWWFWVISLISEVIRSKQVCRKLTSTHTHFVSSLAHRRRVLHHPLPLAIERSGAHTLREDLE